MIEETTYTRLIALLDEHEARYRLIDHAPEGRTELVSAMRGNTLSQAAKCIVLMVKTALTQMTDFHLTLYSARKFFSG